MGRWVDQELKGGRDGFALGQMGEHGGDVAASAVATHGEARRIEAERSGIGSQPVPGQFRIFNGRRVGVIRPHAVFDGDDGDTRTVR